MPFTDVASLVEDPDFADTFSVRRAVATIGTNGRSALSTQTISDVVGVITSESGSNLQRTPDARNPLGAITVHCKLKLISGEGGAEPDIIIWQNREWTVDITNDYSRFGEGFVSARCTVRNVS